MAERAVYLLASGGHASVVLDALQAMGVAVAGILDPGRKAGDAVFGVRVLGGDDWLDGREPMLLANGAGSVPFQSLRIDLFERLAQRGHAFIAVRHPSSVIGRDVVLGEGSQVMAGCVVQCRATIGRNVVVNTRASVDHDCTLGDHAFIGPGATLCGEVRIGARAFIGAGAVVLPGVAVGDGAVVGAGSVVAKPVPDGALVVGVPAVVAKGAAA